MSPTGPIRQSCFVWRRGLRAAVLVVSLLLCVSAFAAPPRCEDGSRPHPTKGCPEDYEPLPGARPRQSDIASMSVPTQMVVGQLYAVSVTYKNIGKDTWTNEQNFRLGSWYPPDNLTWGTSRANLPGPVAPNETVTIPFTVRAPTQPGPHGFQWRMVQDGVEWFGGETPAPRVNVVASNVTGYIDGISGAHLVGWACSTGIETPIDVHLYVGGAAGQGVGVSSTRADLPAGAGVASACGTQGDAHGFRIPIDGGLIAAHQGKPIHVHGISPVGAANYAIVQSGVFVVPANQQPVVALVSPAHGAVYSEGTVIRLSATASDADDGVASVSFGVDGATIGVTSPPNHFVDWVASPGSHTVQASVRDTRGAVALSDSRTVHASKVSGAITGLRDGNIVGWACSTHVPGPIKVRVFIGGPEGAGLPAGEYLADRASPAERAAQCATGSAHDFLITPSAEVLQAGLGKTIHAYGVSALTGQPVALNGSGHHALSANQAPVVRISAPQATTALTSPATTLFSALASDADGVVSDVRLYRDGVLVAELSSAPYQVQLTGLGEGPHTLRAVARDSSGASGSDEITISVSAPQSPASAVRRYVYDAQQRLCKVIEPETGAAVMEYDGAGNLTWSAAGLALPDAGRCDRESAWSSGRRVDRVYDARNRLVELRFPDGRGNQRWEYTPDGLPSKVITSNAGQNAAVVNSYRYSPSRQLIWEESTLDGGSPLSIGYGHDRNGNLSSETRPGGLILSYEPDALGQPRRISDSAGALYAENIAWHPNGALAGMRYGNGIEHQGVLNARMLPSQLKDGTASELLYQYGANGDVSAIIDRQQGTVHDIRMGYDGQGRLTLAQSTSFGGDGAFRYTYDVQDNLLSVQLGGVRSQQFWYDGRNQLTNVRDDAGATVTGLAWDVQGNLLLRNGRKYDFDFGNRLREVQEAERYAYDAYGRRAVAYDDQGQGLRALYSLAGKVVHEDRRGKGASEYIYVGGRLLATRGPTGVTWTHVDALGSPVAVTDGTGSVVERRRFEPYGAELGGQVEDGPGYTGHVSDSATGLSYMQQRYMDPQLGVFLSVDPVTAYEQPVGQFNRYRYANGNPYKFTDPDGRSGKPILPFMDRVEVRSELSAGAIKVERMPQSDMGPTVAQGTVVLLPQRSMQGEPASVGTAVLDSLLNFSQSEGKSVEVTSGQRTVQQNSDVGGAQKSQHLQNNAADIRISGYTKTQTADAAHASGNFNRVNEYPDNRGVHVDLKSGGNQGRFNNWKPQREK